MTVGDGAAVRAEQLDALALKLATHRPGRTDDVFSAESRAEEARFRARQAHLAAAKRYCRAAEVHDHTAKVHEEAAAAGVGDVSAHLHAAVLHRAARDSDYRAADVALEKARRE